MWLASHLVAGAWIYDSVRNERAWLRWLLCVIAGFLTHWLLDSVPVTHSLETLPPQWLGLVLFWNFSAVAGLWYLCVLRKRGFRKLILPNHILAGLVAWLLPDLEHAFGKPIIHQTVFALTVVEKVEYPPNCVLELLFITVGVLVAAPILLRRRGG